MKSENKSFFIKLIFIITCVCCIILVYFAVNRQSAKNEAYTTSSFAMSTIITQNIYGENTEFVAQEIVNELSNFEKKISLYLPDSEIALINANAGFKEVSVSKMTANLVAQAKELSLSSNFGFATTIAPLTLLWGISSDSPSVPQDAEINALLPLIDDAQITVNESESTVKLEKAGQAIDLGGIAKGYACNIAKNVYEEHGVNSALLSIGGNIYAHGTKPSGDLFRIGFKNPDANAVSAAIASCEIKDAVFSVSGGYERYFEVNSVIYHHILDPVTGYPSNSDVQSVGIIHEDGTLADFYSTTLFVKGLNYTLEYFENGGSGMALDFNNNLYVSSNLQSSFELVDDSFNVIFI